MAESYRLALIGGSVGERRGWRQLLEEVPQVDLIMDSDRVPRELSMLVALSPDILMVDELQLEWNPGKPGLLAAWPNLKEAPKLLLTAPLADTAMLKRAIRLGAVTIAQSTEGLPGLRKALALTAETNHRLDFAELKSAFASDDVNTYGLSLHAKIGSFDDLKQQILSEFGREQNDSQIAKSLDIALPTLRKQFLSMLDELGIYTREQLLLLQHEMGMLADS